MTTDDIDATALLASTRDGYDIAAPHYARLVSGLETEGPLERAMLEEFVARVIAASSIDGSVTGPGALGSDVGIDSPPARVLDAGCGAGRLSRHLADQGLTVLGVDLSPGMVAEARASHPDLDFAVGELAALPVPDASMAAVLAWYSIIHTLPSDVPAGAAEFARVLGSGGLVLLGFQSGTGLRRTGGYGTEVRLTAVLHEPAAIAAAFEPHFRVLATLHRESRGAEPYPQAFLLLERTEVG